MKARLKRDTGLRGRVSEVDKQLRDVPNSWV